MKKITSKFFLQLDKRLLLKRKNRDYLRQPASIILPSRIPVSGELLIIAVAYNQFQCITLQQRFLERYMKDPFVYFIADNSSDAATSRAIADFCKHHQIGYAKLPPNPYSGIDGSLSHGMALNWTYANVVKPMKPSFFGFIDHDIFPARPTRLIDFLNYHGAFGVVEERPHIKTFWYLWAGLMFFSSAWLEGKKLDFLPLHGFDSGGGNYQALVHADKNKMIQKLIILEIPPLAPVKFEVAGDWVHLFQGAQVGLSKEKSDNIFNFFNDHPGGW